MTYEVRDPIEVQGRMADGRLAELHGGGPVMVKHYPITFFGREPNEYDGLYLEVWADGSLTVINDREPKQRLWLYDDQWRGVIKALERAMSDKKESARKAHEQWLIENGDKTVHDGWSVTWSINMAKQILSKAEIRWGKVWYGKIAEILVDGRWLHLCRTDLKDDVCTGGDAYSLSTQSLEENRSHYLGRIAYGARRTKDGTGFSIVDSFSDG